MTTGIDIRPISLQTANEFIIKHHRHTGQLQGWKFGVGLYIKNRLKGVASAGRPLARTIDDGRTIEITRVCVKGTAKNACSMLYGALRRAAKALGYVKAITYTLREELGTSLKASGFQLVATRCGDSRPRANRRVPGMTYSLFTKCRWECAL
jgi:hypothetical protein